MDYENPVHIVTLESSHVADSNVPTRAAQPR